MKRWFTSFFVLAATMLAHGQDVRIDPPNWWVGMPGGHVELLVHSARGVESVSIQGDQVWLVEDEAAANAQYHYVTMSVAAKAPAQTVKILVKEKGRRRAKVVHYELKARDATRRRLMGLSPRDQMYLITPDRFANGDTRNDRVRGMKERGLDRSDGYARHGGDLKGIVDQLDYIESLGSTAIWTMPVLVNDMEDGSYHGYAITDHYEVDPRFGSNQDYIDYCEALHSRDMKVVMDMIFNHTGKEHHLFLNPPDSNWFNEWEGYENGYVETSNHRYQTSFDPYASHFDRVRYSDGWFVHTMTDINGRDEHMAQYLIQNSIWWIETCGIDAFRVDTYPYPGLDFMRQWSTAISAVYPDFFIFGESWVHDAHAQAYMLNDQPDLDAGADFVLYYALKSAMEKPSGWIDGVSRVYSGLAADYLYRDKAKDMVIFLDNHDEGRFVGKIDGDKDKYRIGLGMLYSLRGIPCLYYGTEILYREEDDHGAMRQDMAGGWEGDESNVFTGENLSADQQEALAYVRHLAQARANEPLIGTASFMQWHPIGGMYAYAWYDETGALMVFVNMDNEAQTFDLARAAEIGVTEGAEAQNVLDGGVETLGAERSVPPMSITWLKIER